MGINAVVAGTTIYVFMQFSVPAIPPTNPQTYTPTDPTTVTLNFKGGAKSDSLVTWTYAASQLTKISAGFYYAAIDTSAGTYGSPGTWTLEGVGTGDCEVVDSTTVTVNPKRL